MKGSVVIFLKFKEKRPRTSFSYLSTEKNKNLVKFSDEEPLSGCLSVKPGKDTYQKCFDLSCGGGGSCGFFFFLQDSEVTNF